MQLAIFTFDTTHHALWGEEVAKEVGIAFEVVAAPPEANARCSIAIAVLKEDIGRMGLALQNVGVPHFVYKPPVGGESG